MSTWGNTRKYRIIAVAMFVLIMPIIYGVYLLAYRAPLCTDGRQNGEELGPDCGGPCDLYCPGQAVEPVILWQRLFRISNGIYTAAASIQNPNLGAGAHDVPYRIRVFDEDGVSIYERLGTLDIYPKYNFPLIEPGIRVGERTPTRFTLEFLSDPVWAREEEKITPITISEETIYNESSAPRIEARLDNPTPRDILEVNVGAIAYDANDNVIAVSKTVVDIVPKSGSSRVVFTWPEPFASAVVRKEIVILE